MLSAGRILLLPGGVFFSVLSETVIVYAWAPATPEMMSLTHTLAAHASKNIGETMFCYHLHCRPSSLGLLTRRDKVSKSPAHSWEDIMDLAEDDSILLHQQSWHHQPSLPLSSQSGMASSMPPNVNLYSKQAGRSKTGV